MLNEENPRCGTYRHILDVNYYLNKLIGLLLERGPVHDDSKLDSPEAELFEKMTPLLKTTKFNSPEYNEQLKELGPALEHHYANNRHHPQHFNNGVQGMNLIDLLEMLVDWKASSKRQFNGNLIKSIRENQNRFNYSDDLKQILENTAELLE